MATASQEVGLNSLDLLKWKRRVLLYFPRDENGIDPKLYQMEMAERKLIWFEFGRHLSSNFEGAIHQEFASEIKSRGLFGEPGTWVLVGLDGSVKLSGIGAPDWPRILAEIDSMPMRKPELRRKNFL